MWVPPAKLQSSNYSGVLQSDLVAALKNGNDCRLTVFQTLVAKMLPTPASDRPTPTSPTRQPSHASSRSALPLSGQRVAVFFTDDAGALALEWKEKLNKLGASVLLVHASVAGEGAYPKSAVTSADPSCTKGFGMFTDTVYYGQELDVQLPVYVQQIDSRLTRVSTTFDGFIAGCGVPRMMVHATNREIHNMH
jgi:hypothetical protein